MNIAVNSLPVIMKSNDTSVCLNSQVMLFASGGSSYLWSPSVGLSNPNIASPITTPITTTKYFITVSNGGCAKKDSVTITVNNLPVISKSNDTVFVSIHRCQCLLPGARFIYGRLPWV